MIKIKDVRKKVAKDLKKENTRSFSGSNVLTKKNMIIGGLIILAIVFVVFKKKLFKGGSTSEIDFPDI